MSVFLPTFSKILARVYWVMSLVTVKVPNAPEPLACMRRSGITSRTKLASFSWSHTSCESSGPRGPAVRLFWLSGTGAPNWVVRCVAGHFASLSVGLLMALTPIDPRKARRLPPGRTKPEAPPTSPLAAQPESIPENRSPKSSGARGGCPGSGSRTTLRLVRSTCQATRPSGELGVAAPGPILGAVVHVVVDRHLAARPLDGPRGPDVVRREVLHAGDHDLTGDVEDDLTARGRITRRPVFDHHRVDPGLQLGQPDVLGAVGARVVDVLVGVVRGISLHAP